MSLALLNQKIADRSARLVVIGLGYVGLPVAAFFAEAGFDVLGVEIKPERVEKINQGISPIEGEEPGLSEMLEKVVADGKLRATADYQDLADRDIILIDVETPVDLNNVPRYEALRASLKSLGGVIKDGALVIIESTIAPGTMQNTVQPLLEKTSGRKVNEGFYLGNCPERVMPGKLLANLQNLSRVVGGGTPETAETMAELYRYVVQADLDPVDWITAEIVKTTENAYRDQQIAFANEVALICEALGGDVWQVRNLVNKSPYRFMHLPGAGVGGHCIPKDPWLLAYGVKDLDVPLKVIPNSRAVNDNMPYHMAELTEKALKDAGLTMKESRILVMGYSYLEESDDTRASPSEVLVQHLSGKVAGVVIHDPYVPEYHVDLKEAARGCDAAVVMVRHSAYLNLGMAEFKTWLKTPVLVDGRGMYNKNEMNDLGFTYRGMGVG